MTSDLSLPSTRSRTSEAINIKVLEVLVVQVSSLVADFIVSTPVTNPLLQGAFLSQSIYTHNRVNWYIKSTTMYRVELQPTHI